MAYPTPKKLQKAVARGHFSKRRVYDENSELELAVGNRGFINVSIKLIIQRFLSLMSTCDTQLSLIRPKTLNPGFSPKNARMAKGYI